MHHTYFWLWLDKIKAYVFFVNHHPKCHHTQNNFIKVSIITDLINFTQVYKNINCCWENGNNISNPKVKIKWLLFFFPSKFLNDLQFKSTKLVTCERNYFLNSIINYYNYLFLIQLCSAHCLLLGHCSGITPGWTWGTIMGFRRLDPDWSHSRQKYFIHLTISQTCIKEIHMTVNLRNSMGAIALF